MWPGFWFTQVLGRWSGARTPRQPEAPSWSCLVLGPRKVMPARLGQPVPGGSLCCEAPGWRGTQMWSQGLHPRPQSLRFPPSSCLSRRMLPPGLRCPFTFPLWPLLTPAVQLSRAPSELPGHVFSPAGDLHVCKQDSRAQLGTAQEEPGAQRPWASHHASGWGSRQDTAGPAGPCPSAQTEQAGSRWFRSPDNTNACHKVTHCGTAVLWNTQSGQLYRSLETPSRWVVARVWAENGSDDK